ncbi:MAG: hypothetical protein WC370_07010 [Dehalococcoidales bacterium]|jgi:hypothetical protein
MDWLNNIKDFLGTPQGQVTVVVSLLVTIATIILNHAVPAFGKFIWHLPKNSKKWWHTYGWQFKVWNYWRRFSPKYAIIGHGKVVIEFVNNMYQLSLSITIRCQKSDNLNTMLWQCETMSMRIKPKGVKGRTTDFHLTYSQGTSQFSFVSSTSAEATYNLRVFNQIKPTLDKTALCDKIYLGTVHTQGMAKTLKAKSFIVDVDWSKINPPTNPVK